MLLEHLHHAQAEAELVVDAFFPPPLGLLPDAQGPLRDGPDLEADRPSPAPAQ